MRRLVDLVATIAAGLLLSGFFLLGFFWLVADTHEIDRDLNTPQGQTAPTETNP